MSDAPPAEPLAAPEPVPPGIAALMRGPSASLQEQAHLEAAAAAEVVLAQMVGAELLRVPAADAAASPLIRGLLQRVLSQAQTTISPAVSPPHFQIARQTLEEIVGRMHRAHLVTWAPIENEQAS